MSHQLPRREACLNCGEATTADFCPRCGQKNEVRTVSLRLLAADVIEDIFNLDSKVFRTLGRLLSRPGFLTNEYIAGRRASYLSPFRVYLIMSVVFFLVLFWQVKLTGAGGPLFPPLVPEPPPPPGMINQTLRLPAEVGGKTITVAVPEAPSGFDGLVREFRAKQRESEPTLRAGPFKLNLGDLSRTVEEYTAQQRDAGAGKRQDPLQQALTVKVLSVMDHPQEFVRNLQQNIPKMMFLLLPFFALLLKLFYLRQRRLYVEHVIFSLHGHATVFLLLTLSTLVDTAWFSSLMIAASAAYLLGAIRVVYRQSWIATLIKFGAIGVSYALLLAMALVATVLVTVWYA